MSRKQKKKLPPEPVECLIESLSHDGRGIARSGGKTQFVDGALPGERVLARFTRIRGRFDELRTETLVETADDRVEPPCAHAGICGGCSLQHLDTDAQIRFKEATLREQFAHFGGIEPGQWEKPLHGPPLGYRRKARLGVRYVSKRDQVLIGFREKRNSFIADIDACVVLDPRVGQRMTELRQLVRSLSVYRAVPQIEVACGDSAAALVFRHLEPLTFGDHERLIQFGQAHNLQIYLQPAGPESVHRIWPESGPERLSYRLPSQELDLSFHPTDFTQVNSEINRKMVDRALAWLEPGPGDRILDLFCGLGNFSLPLARRAAEVVGVEGDPEMVARGAENARANGLRNLRFACADLQGDFSGETWARAGFDKILIDPPRSGALDIVEHLPAFGAGRIVYVSCNPATLARDAGVLVRQGYRLVKGGVMDMFPHTTHVESIALFERR